MRFVSLFSGAMGLDLGLEQVGFECAICVDNDSTAVETIRLNRPSLPMIARTIEEVTGEELRRQGGFGSRPVPLVCGGPPCQSFSVFGNRLGIEDARGQLLYEFVRVVGELQPDAFLMENVRGLLSMAIVPKKVAAELGDVDPALTRRGSLIGRLFAKFSEIGYRVDCYVVNAVNYGAPQLRERLLLIGNRHGLATSFPAPMYSNRPGDNLPPFRTLGDVIGDGFVDPDPDVLDFSPRKKKYLSMVPPGGNWRSLPVEIQKESMGKTWYLKGGRSAYWRKLSFDYPSPTVVTMPNHAGTSMCHPAELRAISVGEAAAIQEFPPGWRFVGSTTERMRQIGNAVPIRLGRVAGAVISDLLGRVRRNEVEGGYSPPQYRIEKLRPHVRTRAFYKNGKVFAGHSGYYDGDKEDGPKQLEMEL